MEYWDHNKKNKNPVLRSQDHVVRTLVEWTSRKMLVPQAGGLAKTKKERLRLTLDGRMILDRMKAFTRTDHKQTIDQKFSIIYLVLCLLNNTKMIGHLSNSRKFQRKYISSFWGRNRGAGSQKAEVNVLLAWWSAINLKSTIFNRVLLCATLFPWV